MSNEIWKWMSVTHYVDIDTGQIISKMQIGKDNDYIKLKEIDKQIRINHKDYVKTIYRTIGCKRNSAVQQKLW